MLRSINNSIYVCRIITRTNQLNAKEWLLDLTKVLEFSTWELWKTGSDVVIIRSAWIKLAKIYPMTWLNTQNVLKIYLLMVGKWKNVVQMGWVGWLISSFQSRRAFYNRKFFQKCSNINTCVCDPGWSGIDCSQPVVWHKPASTQPTLVTHQPPQGPTPPDEGPTQSHTHVCKYLFLMQYPYYRMSEKNVHIVVWEPISLRDIISGTPGIYKVGPIKYVCLCYCTICIEQLHLYVSCIHFYGSHFISEIMVFKWVFWLRFFFLQFPCLEKIYEIEIYFWNSPSIHSS